MASDSLELMLNNNYLLINNDGLLEGAEYIPSINYNFRPKDINIDLLIIHAASLPEGQYDNNNLEKLFSGNIDQEFIQKYDLENKSQVSTHLYIKRNGAVVQFVPFDKRAWHAGISVFDGVNDCNNYSIGIELQGTDNSYFTESQYNTLINITQVLMQYYPKITKERIVGHSHVAPERKKDPGEFFDWDLYLAKL